MSDTTFIYGLLCPVEMKIRYVGKANNPVARFRQHLSKGYSSKAKKEWLNSLNDRGLRPRLVVLESVAADAWQPAELRWIDQLLSDGHPLTNNHSDIQRKRREAEDQAIFSEAVSLGRQMFG